MSALASTADIAARHFRTKCGPSAHRSTSSSTSVPRLPTPYAGQPGLPFERQETTIAQLKDRIAKTIDYLKSVKQSEIDGTEDKDISITFPSGQTRQFTGQSLLLGNSLPNFWFHTTTAYDIVRQCGIEVGKRDFMGTPPSS